jgi:hypothetical protein
VHLVRRQVVPGAGIGVQGPEAEDVAVGEARPLPRDLAATDLVIVGWPFAENASEP